MRVLITGASGFLGRRMAQALLSGERTASSPTLRDQITQLVLTDRVAFDAVLPTPNPMRVETGDLADPDFCAHLAEQRFDSIFHLAAGLTLDAEADPEAAYAANVAAIGRLLPRQAERRPRFVFASSIAVFGGLLPEVVGDEVRPRPATTYGTQKAIAELMLADMTRRGEVDARCLRLPVVLVRPGAATPSVSDRIAAIIREPLAGHDIVCPLARDTVIPIASAGTVCEALITLHDVLPTALPADRALNFPSLSVSIAQIVAAVSATGGAGAGRIRIAPDPTLQAIVDGWPRRLISPAASALGLQADASVADVIADHLGDAKGMNHGRR
jgi:nucleoside-diphosphate-sugar epimerase